MDFFLWKVNSINGINGVYNVTIGIYSCLMKYQIWIDIQGSVYMYLNFLVYQFYIKMRTFEHTTIPCLPYIMDQRWHSKVTSLHQSASTIVMSFIDPQHTPVRSHLMPHLEPISSFAPKLMHRLTAEEHMLLRLDLLSTKSTPPLLQVVTSISGR